MNTNTAEFIKSLYRKDGSGILAELWGLTEYNNDLITRRYVVI